MTADAALARAVERACELSRLYARVAELEVMDVDVTALEVDAMAAQIIPTDDTPGAREAQVVGGSPDERDALEQAATGKEQHDAHGITGRPTNLTIRNCDIGLTSGDSIQFDGQCSHS